MNEQFNSQQTHQKPEGSVLMIAVAIVVAALMISGTILVKSLIENKGGANTQTTTTTDTTGDTVTVAPITSKDHILGSPNAKIFLIEYSDTECPFCKDFQKTLNQMMAEFGADGRVAWVYRYFPLYKDTVGQPALHSKAGREAEGAECAAELGGNEKFWAYINRIYDITPSNNKLESSELYNIASFIGLDKAKFTACLDSAKYANFISNAYDAALLAGARGTPYTVLLDAKTGETVHLSDALPYIGLKTVIQALLAKSN